jgi:hypothetical protein
MSDPIRPSTPTDLPPGPDTVPAAGIATVGGRPFFPQAGQPHDRCMRCGRATPLGVSLCDADNPGRIGSPSTTQVHGTILAGVVLGFLIIALGGRFVMIEKGPFEASLRSAVPQAAGEVALVLDVTNRGSATAAATCRVGLDASAAARGDLIFQTDTIGPGRTSSFERVLRAPAASAPAWAPERLTVSCA